MKLYNLFEEVILEGRELILENVSDDEINHAIENKYAVLIKYAGKDGKTATGSRLIVPYALGVMPSGNKVIRAMQEDGESKTKPNAWKLFRVDRILSWEKWEEYRNSKAHDGFNPNWDKTMAWVLNKSKY